MIAYKYKYSYDPVAEVWFVFDSEVPGLLAEADTEWALLDEIEELAPILLKAAGKEIRPLSGRKIVPLKGFSA